MPFTPSTKWVSSKLRRDPFAPHRRCLENHKRQRLVFEGKNGIEKMVGKETINFSPEGTEYYINELTGQTHRLNKYTGKCSCEDPVECWKLLVPFLLRNCLQTPINLELVEPTVVQGLPPAASSIRTAWDWIIATADAIDCAELDRTKPLRLTYLPRTHVLALEESQTQKIVWIQTSASSSFTSQKALETKRTQDIRSFFFHQG